MKNIAFFFFLVSQLNSSVALPKVGLMSRLCVTEKQFNSIYSFKDFLNAEIAVISHTTPVGDNEDEACEVGTIKYEDYYFHPAFSTVKINSARVSDGIYKHFHQRPPSTIPFDINTPPPKA